MYLVTAEQMRSIDAEAIEKQGIPSLELMENAGRGIAERIHLKILGQTKSRIAVVCGNGNNGGDGFVIARYLCEKEHAVTAFYKGPDEKLSVDCAENLKRAIASGVTVNQIDKADSLDLSGCTIVVDAIFGTGFSGVPRGLFGEFIEKINSARKTVVTVDMPSGLNADNGMHEGAVVKAKFTFPLALPKYGLFVSPGRELAGEVDVVPIGIPDDVVDKFLLECSLTTADEVEWLLPKRQPDGHKGTFGKVLLVSGSLGLTGATALAARSALRTGCGLAKYASPISVLPIIAAIAPEPTGYPLPEVRKKGAIALRALGEIRKLIGEHDALVLGPGIGLHHETLELIRRLVAMIDKPAIVDADALTAISKDMSLLKSRADKETALVLTPHPGEYKRISGEDVASDIHARLVQAKKFAAEYQVTLLLKGSPTIVAHHDGRAALNPTGNHGMATGGSGDVLSGIIGSLLAQGMSGYDAAVAGAYIHGLAGDLAADVLTARAVISSDILDNIPDALAFLDD